MFFLPDIHHNPFSGVVGIAIVSAGPLYEQSSWLPDGAPHTSQEFHSLLPLMDEASSQ